MSASFNKVILVGNLTGDPELQYTSNAKARVKFSMAMNRKYKGADGQQQEDVTFVPITVWGNSAEACAKYLSKGSPVMVEGRLRITSYTDEDGNKKKYTEVVAQTVQFLGSRPAFPEAGPDVGDGDNGVPF